MADCTLRDGTIISDYGRPYIISEVNSSHNGSIELAKQLIDVSADMGCDCVKFQSWSVSSLYSRSYYDTNPIAERFVNKFSLNSEQLVELAQYCKNKNISFSSTPYSEAEVDFLIENCDVPFIKISSMELNNPRFIRYIGKKNIPVIVSTGMSTFNEIDNAVKVLEDAGVKQMCILHCVSIYPTILTNVNLNNIIGLRKRYDKYPIGFSDHTEGDEASIAAVALGAGVIEKHLTLDRSKIGMDNGMAMEPLQLKALVSRCRSIQVAMGTEDRVLMQQEIEQRKNMRRSIVTIKDIKAGDIIRECDLYAKRPGTGFAPNEMYRVVGKRATVDIGVDVVVMPEHIK